MAKKTRKKKSIGTEIVEKRKGKKLPIKKLITVIGLFTLSTALYYALASAGYGIVYPAYVTLAGILIIAYFIVNKGIVSVPDRERLDPLMTEPEKDAFLAEIRENRKRSAPILYVFSAMTLTVLCDTLYAQMADGVIGDMLSRLFEAFGK